MSTLLSISFPIKEPILIFALVLVIILIFPTLFKKLRIPEIIGLIIAGVIVGPNGVNLLSQDIGLSIFSQTGLLYLMFLAGLEINVKQFLNNKVPSITYGILSFLLPFVLSGLLFFYIFNFDFIASLLISSMIATHTLVAYPIIGRFGISKNKVVNIIIGATVIVDTIALLILAIVSESTNGELDHLFWIKFVGYFAVFIFMVLWIIPKLSRWFFKNYDGESSSEYIFVLTMVFIAAVIAEYAHIEPIIGAFFVGLAMSRLIPHTSPLMNRIVFIGNTIFIPFFLITVGMYVDLNVLTHGKGLILIIIAFIVVAILSKYLAAFILQKLFNFNKLQRNLMFGLSNARAASAIAIVLVGYNLELIDESVVNATVILVLVSTLISSFVTQYAARKIAIKQEKEIPDISDNPERILLPISNPDKITQLVNFAVLIKDEKSDLPLYPLTVVNDDHKASENILNFTKILEKAQEHASSSDKIARIVSRIDTNVADGIARTVKELLISKVVMGWHGKSTTKDFFFGTLLQNVLDKTGKMVYVTRISSAINLIENIHVFMPPATEFEIGFLDWVKSVLTISTRTNSKITFWGYEHTHRKIKNIIAKYKYKNQTEHRTAKCPNMFKIISQKIQDDDLLIIINARKNTISYNKYIKQIPNHVEEYFQYSNVVIIYPEQETVYRDSINLQV
ncbi:MAG: cation:proton antiporter [Bacteroidetes bacterium]|nr:cation:proton antiporter [Bacteroidota bacterium]